MHTDQVENYNNVPETTCHEGTEGHCLREHVNNEGPPPTSHPPPVQRCLVSMVSEGGNVLTGRQTPNGAEDH